MSSYLHVIADGCSWFFSMRSTLKNARLAERYTQLAKERYSEPANEKVLGYFITEAFLPQKFSFFFSFSNLTFANQHFNPFT